MICLHVFISISIGLKKARTCEISIVFFIQKDANTRKVNLYQQQYYRYGAASFSGQLVKMM